MRNREILVMAGLALALAGCSGQAKKAQARADARAKDFVPPSITTRLDYGSSAERRFRQLDRNGDDYLTPDELPTKDSKLMVLDRNHDGKISEIEWSDGMLNRFDRMDVNHDGAVSSEERQAARNLPLQPTPAATATGLVP